MLKVRFGALPDGLDAIDADHGLQVAEVLSHKEGQGDALSAHSCRSSRAMCICVRIGGKVVVNNVCCVREVQSAAGKVRGHHDLDFHSAKPVKK